MSWRDAPLYVEAHALAVDQLARLPRWRELGHLDLASACARHALALVDAVGRALTFPAERDAALVDADHAVLGLRLAQRVALDLALLSPGAHRALVERGLRCGRMIGGWRRRLGAEPRAPPT